MVASSSSVPYTQRGCKNLEPSDEISPLQIYHDQLSLISKDSSCTSLHNSTKNEEIFSRKKLVDGHSSCLLDETDTQKNGVFYSFKKGLKWKNYNCYKIYLACVYIIN